MIPIPTFRLPARSLANACLALPLLLLFGCDLESGAPSEPGKTLSSSGENIDAAEKAMAAKLKPVKDPVGKAVNAFRNITRGHYNNRRFAELEKSAAAIRAEKPIFGNGSWKIAQFYGALKCRNDESESMWQLHDGIHREWIEAYPNSITARIAYADFLTSYAWQARGSGYANKVTEEGWRLFGQRLEDAAKILGEARKLPEKDPYWAQAAMTVALGQGWPKLKYDVLVEAAKKEEPKFWGYDTARAYSLLPRWYGEPGDWEAYAESAAARPDGLGAETYARIVMEQRRFYDNIFRESSASWPKTREGLEILREKYPDSLAILSQSAMLATIARDREFAKAMFDKLGDNYLPSVFRKPESFVHYRNWAETGEW